MSGLAVVLTETEGVMVYNHLKDKVKTFLQPFAESGQAVGAEDIKAYFEKLRGDADAIRAAGGAAAGGPSDGDGKGDNRKEQSGMSDKSPATFCHAKSFRLLEAALLSPVSWGSSRRGRSFIAVESRSEAFRQI